LGFLGAKIPHGNHALDRAKGFILPASKGFYVSPRDI